MMKKRQPSIKPRVPIIETRSNLPMRFMVYRNAPSGYVEEQGGNASLGFRGRDGAEGGAVRRQEKPSNINTIRLYFLK